MPVLEYSVSGVAESPRVGKPAPYFKVGLKGLAFSLDDFRGKWLMLLSQPAEYTPVDAAGLKETIGIYPDLKKHGVAVLFLGVSDNSSLMYRVVDLPEDIFHGVSVVIKGRVAKETATSYGRVWLSRENTPGRCVYIIDGEGIVKAILYYPIPVNGHMKEALNVLEALQTSYTAVLSSSIWECDSYG